MTGVPSPMEIKKKKKHIEKKESLGLGLVARVPPSTWEAKAGESL